MPEGPELHLSSRFINAICKNRIFTGKVRRNPIHKCADIVWDAAAYTISASSRGKELMVFLQSLSAEELETKTPRLENGVVESKKDRDSTERLQILFNFGMSGKFEFTSVSQMPKHAHLSFYTKTEPAMALSFVDYRRFGKWQVGADWAPDRGPCVMFEYPQFRCDLSVCVLPVRVCDSVCVCMAVCVTVCVRERGRVLCVCVCPRARASTSTYIHVRMWVREGEIINELSKVIMQW